MKFKAKAEEVKYPMTGKYNDDSKSILKETGVFNDEDHYADDDAAYDDDEKPLDVEEQYRGDEEDVEIVDLEKCYIFAKKKMNCKKHSRNFYFLQLLPHLIKSNLKSSVFNKEQQKLTEGKSIRHRNEGGINAKKIHSR